MMTITVDQDENKIRDMLNQLLTEEHSDARSGILYRTIVKAIERPLFEHVLKRTEGNQLKAARILGINRNTMRAKIKKLGIDVKRWKVH